MEAPEWLINLLGATQNLNGVGSESEVSRAELESQSCQLNQFHLFHGKTSPSALLSTPLPPSPKEGSGPEAILFHGGGRPYCRLPLLKRQLSSDSSYLF